MAAAVIEGMALPLNGGAHMRHAGGTWRASGARWAGPQRDRQQLGAVNLREPGWLQATAGSKQIHRTQRYVKVCPSLSFWSCRHAGVFYFFTPPPSALMQRAEGKGRPRGLALQASVGPREEEEEDEEGGGGGGGGS